MYYIVPFYKYYMTREQQLESCKVCKHQKFDPQQGIICGHTNSIATFQNECELFEIDTYLQEHQQKMNKEKALAQKTVSAGTRFANRILDILFILVVNILFYILLGVIAALGVPSILTFVENENTILIYMVSFMISFCYYTILESLTGRTMAKLITRTKVVAENGEKANFDAIVLRSICRFIPFDAFSFLVEDARGWHDTLSKTRVISVK
ncbi:MAG: putative RDD family membrane protein YckC [Dokdonia sp.]|jgi:uncharacterized RDD family membrane protein YckC